MFHCSETSIIQTPVWPEPETICILGKFSLTGHLVSILTSDFSKWNTAYIPPIPACFWACARHCTAWREYFMEQRVNWNLMDCRVNGFLFWLCSTSTLYTPLSYWAHIPYSWTQLEVSDAKIFSIILDKLCCAKVKSITKFDKPEKIFLKPWIFSINVIISGIFIL